MNFQVFPSITGCVGGQELKTLASYGWLLLYLVRLWRLEEAARRKGKECGRVSPPYKIHPSSQEECPVRQLDNIR